MIGETGPMFFTLGLQASGFLEVPRCPDWSWPWCLNSMKVDAASLSLASVPFHPASRPVTLPSRISARTQAW